MPSEEYFKAQRMQEENKKDHAFLETDGAPNQYEYRILNQKRERWPLYIVLLIAGMLGIAILLFSNAIDFLNESR